MTKWRLVIQPVLVVTGCMFGCPSYAVDLSGAWATDASMCDKVFVKKGNTLSFTSDSEIHGSGFIIEGNRIRGQSANCSIKARKDVGDVVHPVASCASDVMMSSMQLSNDNTIARLFPEMPELQAQYARCSL